MSRSNRLLVGFVIGAVILGIIGALLAPSLLGLAGVAIGHAVTQTLAVNSALLPIHTWTAGVTPAVFGQLETGIAVFMGLIGGLVGGLMGVANRKTESYPALERSVPLSSITPINNEKATGYAPSLDVDGQETGKSFVKSYEQEKQASSQSPPGQWLH